MTRAVRATRCSWWDLFERSPIYTVPIYPGEALCGDEECYKTEKDKCQGRSWGTLRGSAFPICGVHLHWLAETCPPACVEEAEAACDRGQGRDVAKTVGDEPVTHQPQKKAFIISSAIFGEAFIIFLFILLLSLLCLLTLSFILIFSNVWFSGLLAV